MYAGEKREKRKNKRRNCEISHLAFTDHRDDHHHCSNQRPAKALKEAFTRRKGKKLILLFFGIVSLIAGVIVFFSFK